MSKYDPVSEGRINCIEKDGVTEGGWRGGVISWTVTIRDLFSELFSTVLLTT